jgi:hypothetical protein
LEEEKYNIESGEEKAWRELMDADPKVVARRSLARYDPDTRSYSLDSLGEEFVVDPVNRTVTSTAGPDRKVEHLLKLSLPVYMLNALDLPPSGELVKELKGGEFFFRGSHTLPLEALGKKYGSDRELFVKAGKCIGGTPVKMGDAAFTFHALPRVVMCFLLWLEDDEFPARVSLLFDSNAGRHMQLDVVWAVALVACLRMLSFSPPS